MVKCLCTEMNATKWTFHAIQVLLGIVLCGMAVTSRYMMIGTVLARVHWSEVTTDRCTLCAQYGNDDYWINVCDRSVVCYRVSVQYSYAYRGILYYDAANQDYYTSGEQARKDCRGKYAANSTTSVFIDSRVPNTSALMRGRLPFRVTVLDVLGALVGLLFLSQCVRDRSQKRTTLPVHILPTIVEEEEDNVQPVQRRNACIV